MILDMKYLYLFFLQDNEPFLSHLMESTYFINTRDVVSDFCMACLM